MAEVDPVSITQRPLSLLVCAALALGPLSAFAAPDIQCPEGSQLVEGHSEDGRRANWCEVKGKKTGPYIEFFEGGKVRARGHFERGQKNGEFVFWHESGKMESQGEFEDGLHVGEWVRWHQNGQKRDQGEWERDQPEGNWQAWFDNGNLKFTGNFVHGQKEGHWSEWDSTGIKREEATYKRGKKQCLIGAWDESGRRTARFKDLGGVGCEETSGDPGFDPRMMEVSIRGATFDMGTKKHEDDLNHGGVGFAWLPTYQTGWRWLRFRGILGMSIFRKGKSEDHTQSNDGFRTYQGGALISFVPFRNFFGEFGFVYRHVPVDEQQKLSRNSAYVRLGWQSERPFLGFIQEIALSHQSRKYPFGMKITFGSIDIGFRL